MFDLLNNKAPSNETVDVESGLSRFKKETGVNFLDLLNDKQLRAKFLVDSASEDTLEDEKEIQRAFESSQKKLLADN